MSEMVNHEVGSIFSPHMTNDMLISGIYKACPQINKEKTIHRKWTGKLKIIFLNKHIYELHIHIHICTYTYVYVYIFTILQNNVK